MESSKHGSAQEIEGRLDPTLWVVTSRAGDRAGGLVATFVSTASIVPSAPRVLVGIARRHHTHALIASSGAFALHLLDDRPEHLDWLARFALQSGATADKLAGLDTRPGRSGSPVLAAAAGWMDCRVEAALDTGDRTAFLAEVLDAGSPSDRPPLTLRRALTLLPEPTLRAWKALRERDAASDAEAIAAWRARSGTRSGRVEP